MRVFTKQTEASGPWPHVSLAGHVGRDSGLCAHRPAGTLAERSCSHMPPQGHLPCSRWLTAAPTCLPYLKNGVKLDLLIQVLYFLIKGKMKNENLLGRNSGVHRNHCWVTDSSAPSLKLRHPSLSLRRTAPFVLE